MKLPKELEVEKKIVECNSSIAKMQETQLQLYKSQLEIMHTIKEKLYIGTHQQKAVIAEHEKKLTKLQGENTNMHAKTNDLKEMLHLTRDQLENC